MEKKVKNTRKWSLPMTGLFALFCTLLVVGGLFLTQVILLQNSQQWGNQLARQCSDQALSRLEAVESCLDLMVGALDEKIRSGAQREDLTLWAEEFVEKVSLSFSGTIHPYAAVNGQLFPTTSADQDLFTLPWYEKACKAQGEPVYLLAPDAEDPGIIVARQCPGKDAVLAFAASLESENGLALPQGSSYYLCDAQGQLLYARTEFSADSQQLSGYIHTIFQQIKAGQLDDAKEYVYGLTSEKRAVYFTTAENGWVSIITIPYSALLGNLRQVFYGACAICGAFFSLLLFFGLRERLARRKTARAAETVAALGNLYYAIYRVNVGRGSYEVIKGSEYVLQQLPPTGPYENLMQVIGQLIDKETFSQFSRSFSLNNLHRLMEENVSDFGGDFRRKFGDDYRWVNVRLLFAPSLQPQEAVLCFRQVDEEKSSQLQHLHMLEGALERARDSEQSQSQFFSQMSHDMRTPLNVILGSARLAQDQGDDPKKVTGCLQKIILAASQLLELINDILEMSRTKQTELQLKNQQFNLKESAEQWVSAFQSQAELEQKELTLSLDLPRPVVHGDPFRLQQIMGNLLSNALKFTHPGDKIQVEFSQPGEKVCRILVRDTGMGMSAEFLPQLFTPYARENRFGTQTVLGTGLGMPIVHAIVTQMGGQIQVESAPGEGTTFTLTLPMELVDQPLPDPAPEKTEEPSKETPPFEGKHFLLAEDFEMNLEIATQLLNLWGAQVTPVRNGQEAVDAFTSSQEGEFDAILMDVNMPVMDGCAAASAIRAMNRPDAVTIPILALTANAFAEDMAATAQAGMNAHITKPIDPKQLAQALQDLSK